MSKIQSATYFFQGDICGERFGTIEIIDQMLRSVF